MAQITAGLLMCRKTVHGLEYFLVHPGGPFFQKKNEGWWTIPKGLPEKDEALLQTAQREFKEETGIIPSPPFHALGSIKQKGGKTIHAWAFWGTWDPSQGIVSNEFEMQWPPNSGKYKKFREIDKGAWMDFTHARKMINVAQIPFLEKATEALNT